MDEFMSGGFESSSSESDKLPKKSRSAKRRERKNAKKNIEKERYDGLLMKDN
jgi:hypothetical protein